MATTITKAPQQKSNQLPILIVVSVLAVGLGVGLGWLLRSGSSDQPVTLGGGQVEIQAVATDETQIKAGDIFGSADESTFKDHASGYLAEGGIGGEGSHHLLRPGGAAQTVYLTSSVTDLDKMVGMEVEVWGETFAGEKAGWLMDVGRIKVVNPTATNPEAASAK